MPQRKIQLRLLGTSLSCLISTIISLSFHIIKFKLEYLYSQIVRLRIKFVGTERFEAVLGNYPRHSSIIMCVCTIYGSY